MINEIRTLLLNENGSSNYPPDYPGEEYVPPDFKAVSLPHNLREIYNTVFGHKADRAFKNLMLYSYMKIIHSIPKLAFYVYENDSRVTYYPADTNLFDWFLKGPKVTKTNNDKILTTNKYHLLVPGTRIHYSYDIEVTSGSTISVNYTDNAGNYVTDSLPFTTDGSFSLPVSLPLSELDVQFEPTVGAAWNVEFVIKPKIYIEQIIFRVLNLVATEHVSSLFDKGVKPYSVLKEYWNSGADMSLKIGALILALAYNIRDFKNG